MLLKNLVWCLGVIPVLWIGIIISAGVGYARPQETFSATLPDFAVTFSAPTLPITTTTWFVENSAVLGGYDLKDISCPSPTVCKVISNQAILGWDGLAWVKEYEREGGEYDVFYDIDCPTIGFCKVVGQMTSTISWDGTVWTADPGTENHLNTSVSCVSPDFCMVSSDHAFLSWDGQSWSYLSLGSNTSTHVVACTSPTFCMSTMSFFYGSHIWGGYIGVWDGTTWADSLSAPYGYFEDVSCASPTLCKAIGGSGLYTWDGTEWLMSDNNFSFSRIRCLSAAFCKALGYYGSSEPYTSTINSWDGVTWTVEYEATPPQDIKGVDCYSPLYCKAVGSAGVVATMFTQAIHDVSEGFELEIAQIPSCLASVVITELEELPPHVTPEMLPGRSWQVTKEGCNQPITGSLTLPMPTTLEPTDMVCTYTGRLWQCVEPIYNPELMTQATINGFIHLGDWAIRRPGPNASAYQQFLPLIQAH